MGIAYEGTKWLRGEVETFNYILMEYVHLVYLESLVSYQRRVNVSTLLASSSLPNERIPLDAADESAKDTNGTVQRQAEEVYESTITRHTSSNRYGHFLSIYWGDISVLFLEGAMPRASFRCLIRETTPHFRHSVSYKLHSTFFNLH